ncbi:MAG TPA: ArsC family (seleno)protein [Pirellulales bacterium]|jgi:arsenate reductase-like glutaredoxin family protein|nr:ArsC family (seleno)protein [Pirellulales bacterium]
MAGKIDWYYHRNHCVTCGRAQAFLTAARFTIAAQVDARRERIEPAAALKLARSADEIWVARGQKVVHFDLTKDAPSDDELKKLILGPSGFLRAPTIRRGKKLYVGFHPEAFPKLLAP